MLEMSVMTTFKDHLKAQAKNLGFDLVGIARATEADSLPRFEDWLERGYAGQMHYMHKHAQARQHPSSILSEVKSVVMVGLNHTVAQADHSASIHGRIARYAQSEDYHDVIRRLLKSLLRWVKEQNPDCHGRGIVDTAPLLERDFARRAGLGWHGKNTMLLNKHQGSYFFLGALLLDMELEPDPPMETSHCGTCTACLNACPTNAFPEPGMLDARRCISYLTIELRESIPEEYRKEMSEWVFGCDVCQEVCPWNRKAPGESDVLPRREDLQSLDLIATLSLTEEEFRQQYRGTALYRTGRVGLLRNAAIVLGNLRRVEALPALRVAAEDEDEIVAEAAQWAISQITTNETV